MAIVAFPAAADDAETNARIAADNAEAATRATADSTFTTNLATEITNRTNADTTETSARIAADNAEATTRASADSTLTTNLATEVTNRTNADTAETSARIAADATLQPLDSDLTAIAAIAPANDDFIQRKSGVWVNRTVAQIKTDLNLVADTSTALTTETNARIALDASAVHKTGNETADGIKTFVQPIVGSLTGAVTGDVTGNLFGNAATVTLTNSTPQAEAVTSTGAVGTGTAPSRSDHVHAMPGFAAVVTETAFGQAATNGVATTLPRSDHTHGTPATSLMMTAVTPTAEAVGSAAAVGTGVLAAREDHRHAMPAFAAVVSEITAGQAAANGVATTVPRSDHTHGTPPHTLTQHTEMIGLTNLSDVAITSPVLGKTLFHNGTQFVDIDFDTQVRTSRLDQMATPGANIPMAGYTLINLPDPILSGDTSTKLYTDGARAGLFLKQSVRLATTANITLSGNQTIDGVTTATNDRVLVKNQTTTTQNGIYTTAAGAWSRAADANTANSLPQGSSVFVTEGTVNLAQQWVAYFGTSGALWVPGVDTTLWTLSALYPPYNNVVTATTFGISASNGVLPYVARSDHTHGTPPTSLAMTSATPVTEAIGDTTVVGTGVLAAREDHRHAMPAFAAVTAATTFGIAAANGSAVSVARSDHTHGSPATSLMMTAATPAAEAVGSVAVVGTAVLAARADHVHAMPGFAAVVTETAFGQAAANGVATTLPRSDHTHGTPATSLMMTAVSPTAEAIGSATAVGTGVLAAREDHVHAMPSFGSPAADPVGSTAADGVAVTVARSDHRHAITALVKSDVGLGNVDNTSDVNKPVSTAQQAAITNETNARVAADATLQPLDTDLTAIAALTPANDDIVQRKAGAWTNRTIAQVKTDLAVNNIDNTSDVNKPVSTAQAAADATKQPIDSDLTTIAALAPANDDVIQRKAGAWTNRTMAQVKTDLVLNTVTLVTTTINYAVLLTDSVVISNGTSLTITLPSAVTAGSGRQFTIKNIAASSVTLASSAGTIDNAASYTIPTMAFTTVVSDGAKWWRTG